MTDGMLFTGKTVEDAVAEGLRSLGLAQDQVEIEVVNRGSRGLFGIGSEPAQVRITPRRTQPAASRPVAPAPAPGASRPASTAGATRAESEQLAPQQPPSQQPAAPEPQAPQATTIADGEALAAAMTGQELEPGGDAGLNAAGHQAPLAESAGEPAGDEVSDDELSDGEIGDDELSDELSDDEMVALAVELLSETVQRMGFDAEVVASWQEPDADNDEPYLLLNLHGRDLGALIGRRGDTLSNLQYLLRLMVNQRLHQWKNIVVDVEQYRQHRTEHLMQLALRSADQVADTGRPLSLEPMPPNERRIIHLALRDHANVYTESSGEGERRKIQILPKRS